jgi:hypothetical protein
MAEGSGRAVDDLEALARARFPDLSQAELKLLRAAPRGEVAWCGPSDKDDDPANDPAKADEWGPEREIRAELIRWLCVDRDAASAVDPIGVRLRAAKLTGGLDLSFASAPFPLRLTRCCLTHDANLISTELPALSLAGSRVLSIVPLGPGSPRLAACYPLRRRSDRRGAQRVAARRSGRIHINHNVRRSIQGATTLPGEGFLPVEPRKRTAAAMHGGGARPTATPATLQVESLQARGPIAHRR